MRRMAGAPDLFESLGAKAVATSSAAVAWSHGYADGNVLPVPLLIATVTDIARAVRVPVSVDVEGGYSDEPAQVAETVAAVIEAGGVGINLEDGAGEPDLLCAKIEAVKRTAARLGVALFVNARTDVYLKGLAPADRRVEVTLARAERYRAAGADGLFVAGVTAPAEIAELASKARLPLNVLARKGLPATAELRALGVRRLSAGSALAESAFAKMASLASDFLRTGESAPLSAEAMPYPELNRLMSRQ